MSFEELLELYIDKCIEIREYKEANDSLSRQVSEYQAQVAHLNHKLKKKKK